MCHASLMTLPVSKVQWKTSVDGQRNCPKHVEFLGKNKFGKISASVGFIKKKKSVAQFPFLYQHLSSGSEKNQGNVSAGIRTWYIQGVSHDHSQLFGCYTNTLS